MSPANTITSSLLQLFLSQESQHPDPARTEHWSVRRDNHYSCRSNIPVLTTTDKNYQHTKNEVLIHWITDFEPI